MKALHFGSQIQSLCSDNFLQISMRQKSELLVNLLVWSFSITELVRMICDGRLEKALTVNLKIQLEISKLQSFTDTFFQPFFLQHTNVVRKNVKTLQFRNLQNENVAVVQEKNLSCHDKRSTNTLWANWKTKPSKLQRHDQNRQKKKKQDNVALHLKRKG